MKRSLVIAALGTCLLGARADGADLRIGIIGLDTSHVIAFTRSLNDASSPDHVPGGRVVAAFKGGSPDVQASASRVDKFTAELQATYGVRIVGTIAELCDLVDAVLLESVDGRVHLEQAREVLRRRKPLFVDKPMAASFADASELARLAKESGTPWFSSSSLRFAPAYQEFLADPGHDTVLGVEAHGPASLEPTNPGLFWYGIHSVETLFTLMGPGCVSVAMTSNADYDLAVGVWKDGRIGSVKGLRKGKPDYGALVYGEKGVAHLSVKEVSYVPLVRRIMDFFRTGRSPVPAEETLEIMAFMDAAERSRISGGVPMTLAAQSYQELLKRFDYDAAAPLDVRETGAESRPGVKVHDVSYVSPKGGRVPAYLVVPDGPGPFAAVIWGHWYWGNSEFRNRGEFLDEAVALARAGVVSLLFDGPVARPGFYDDRTPLNEKQIDDRVQTILDVRRGADLLLARKDVDPARLAFVGHSYNASTGGYLAGVDKRFTAFVLMAGSLSDKVDLDSEEYRKYRLTVGPAKWDAFIGKYAWLDPGLYLAHAAPAAVLMQYATKEDFLTVERAKRYAALVSEPKDFRVYEAPHALNAEARRDRLEFLQRRLRLRGIDWKAVAAVPALVQPPPEPPVRRKTCISPDGVTIVYSVAGTSDTGLLFIHGGLADRSFFQEQFHAFSGKYRVVAVDLAGHGESGTNRREWGMARFAADVKAVVDAEGLKRVVLFGNSLGGPVAIEAARLLPGRALGVVGIDTFQDLDAARTPDVAEQASAEARKRAEAFKKDYAGSMKAMVRLLFHPDADPWLMGEAERRMMRTSPEVAYAVVASLVGYDYTAAARQLAVPLRTINGDIYPTDVQAARTVKPDFDAVVMKHMGHYPMLERPAEFNRRVAEIVASLDKR